MNFDWSPLWISLQTGIVATAIATVLGIGTAHWMTTYRGKGKALLETIAISPLVLPPTVVGFLLLWLLGKNGPLGRWFLHWGFEVVFSWPATAIAATVVAFPLTYKMTAAAFAQLDPNWLRAARSLGASEGRIAIAVMLPLAWPGIAAGILLAFARALGEFGATLMLAGNIPGKTQTIPLAIYFAVETGNTQAARFWVTVVLGISLSAIAVVNGRSPRKRYWRQRRQRQSQIEHEIPRVEATPSPNDVRLGFPQENRPSPRATQLEVEIEKELEEFDLNIALQSGSETLGLLGASGSGKSMTLLCIAGLEEPTRGRIELNGRVLFDRARGIDLPARDRRVGIVFQNYALFPHLTVAENIAFGLPRDRRHPKAKRDRAVADYLRRMHLEGLENRYPEQLSGGQQQRVALARAIAARPEVLLLDEPFSALDTYLRSQLERQLVETLSDYGGVTIFVTHNLEEAYRVCQNLLVLSRGRAIAYGSKQAIFERPETYTVAQLTGCKNFSRARELGDGQIEALDWGCRLRAIDSIPAEFAFIGIRAHQIRFLEEWDESTTLRDRPSQNRYPCWIAQTSETQHRMTLYLKLHDRPSSPQDYHLQAELFKEKWERLKDRPFPWQVYLDPLRLILMRSRSDASGVSP
ncbi:molybdate ABC transporter permease subunit [Oxynema sp. CENA135]|uniref:molybdate ABC transporter permease subunit n=1 Tax=Oxynema sp. CENA135 TaxID=984206 RepID=UPI0019098BBE|nr:molybdate ABC transporter permease subunit [Oxynema sp. CENA135]MBK4728397.1 molybdate ABC transporter permease subunit [Oxynema sp. CENA135]